MGDHIIIHLALTLANLEQKQSLSKRLLQPIEIILLFIYFINRLLTHANLSCKLFKSLYSFIKVSIICLNYLLGKFPPFMELL